MLGIICQIVCGQKLFYEAHTEGQKAYYAVASHVTRSSSSRTQGARKHIYTNTSSVYNITCHEKHFYEDT